MIYKVAVARIRQEYVEVEADNVRDAYSIARHGEKELNKIRIHLLGHSITNCALVPDETELCRINVSYPNEIDDRNA